MKNSKWIGWALAGCLMLGGTARAGVDEEFAFASGLVSYSPSFPDFAQKVVDAVLAKDPRWAHIQDVDDLDEWTKGEINHFFEHYKDLEPGKWVKVDQWAGAAEAERLVSEAFERFQAEGAQTATQGEGHAPKTI